MKPVVLSALASAFILGSGWVAGAETPSLGQAEYLQSCASCHGEKGDGAGFLAAYLKEAPPAITALAAGNGGVFPVQRVYQIIDGTSAEGAHGPRSMPVWGLRYSALARQELEPFSLGFADRQQEFVRLRILALVEYVSSLQGN